MPAGDFPPLADYGCAPHLVKKRSTVRFHAPHILLYPRRQSRPFPVLGSSFIYISPTDRASLTPPSHSPFNIPHPLPTETALRRVRRAKAKIRKSRRKRGRDPTLLKSSLISSRPTSTTPSGGRGGVPLCCSPRRPFRSLCALCSYAKYLGGIPLLAR